MEQMEPLATTAQAPAVLGLAMDRQVVTILKNLSVAELITVPEAVVVPRQVVLVVHWVGMAVEEEAWIHLAVGPAFVPTVMLPPAAEEATPKTIILMAAVAVAEVPAKMAESAAMVLMVPMAMQAHGDPAVPYTHRSGGLPITATLVVWANLAPAVEAVAAVVAVTTALTQPAPVAVAVALAGVRQLLAEAVEKVVAVVLEYLHSLPHCQYPLVLLSEAVVVLVVMVELVEMVSQVVSVALVVRVLVRAKVVVVAKVDLVVEAAVVEVVLVVPVSVSTLRIVQYVRQVTSLKVALPVLVVLAALSPAVMRARAVPTAALAKWRLSDFPICCSFL